MLFGDDGSASTRHPSATTQLRRQGQLSSVGGRRAPPRGGPSSSRRASRPTLRPRASAPTGAAANFRDRPDAAIQKVVDLLTTAIRDGLKCWSRLEKNFRQE